MFCEPLKVIKKEYDAPEIQDNQEKQDAQEYQENQENIYHDQEQINLTLQYMMNRDLYENYILSQNETTKEDVKEERKFYRSRIFQLVKVLLLSEKERIKYFEMNPQFDLSAIQFDVFLTFDAFVKNAICNFKMIDTNDLLQEGYPEYTEDNRECGEYIEPDFRKKKNTLDNFVISEKPEEKIILPLQKKIDLKDPIFKKKGLRKCKTQI